MPTPTKPTALKALEGNRGKRPLNKNEPEPDLLNDLEAPEWLPEPAKAVWRELAWKLRKAKVLTVLDVPALEKACVAIATYRAATLACGMEFLIAGKAKDGAAALPAGKAMNPWLIIQSMSFKQAMVLLREFGMTPAARSRVMIDPQLGLFGNGNSGQDKNTSYFT